ncbi:conserved hypothetical protein [Neospora caninum Liverpool]|uniref:Uncharacterized protein n=1 Tax=Neospora caninum (strain Liverpool) TaxID=572307 RepID=F0VF60_NEOCL|nr:conserved hypothetical protein [Neospora caninum Liverpool]CBZ52354.1 conserved hypothetical protein [Neospora caninum Liverpool]CEL66324.1 TPA: hypothetical protein BN1204_021420 [Neospora caninum Liverpool]|eukprot:XP_003882386.1 conserved hypothetical protein [Neospora caninum Liverpool]
MTTTEPSARGLAAMSPPENQAAGARASDPVQAHYLTTYKVHYEPKRAVSHGQEDVPKFYTTVVPEHLESFPTSLSLEDFPPHIETRRIKKTAEEVRNEFETTYAEAFSERNSVKITRMDSLASPTLHKSTPTLFQYLPQQAGPKPMIKKDDILQFAANNTFKTVYKEKFSETASAQNLGRSSDSTGIAEKDEFRTEPLSSSPAWGVSERPPPHIPGPQWTYSAEKAQSSMADRSTYETSYQYRTRPCDVVSDAVDTPRHYTVLGTGQIVTDRRHDSFSRYASLEKKRQEVDEAEAERNAVNAALGMPLKKPNATDVFVGSTRRKSQDSLVLREDNQARRNAGLNAFQESVYKFEPNKPRINLGVPYCQPWKPLVHLQFTVPSQAFPVSSSKSATAADRFIPLSPTARFDGRMAGLRRKGQDQ